MLDTLKASAARDEANTIGDGLFVRNEQGPGGCDTLGAQTALEGWTP
jgi:hypothetical protein